MSSEGVMSTNDDASNCKRYATHKNYWKDDFIEYFVRNIPQRKAPEINRGYYVRHFSIMTIVERFLAATNCECQIVSLGSGFDTLFWNLNQKQISPRHGLYEIDMKPVVQKKMRCIQTKPPLSQALKGDLKTLDSQLHSKDYHLLAADLTDIQNLKQILLDSGLDLLKPTLFVVECVFVYIKHESVKQLLDFISSEFETSLVVDYDPVNLNDRFGEVMKQNLRGRDCHLLGAHDSVQSKIDSFGSFQNVHAKLLVDIYNDLPLAEKTRIERLEFLDEVDLLFDLLRHYCICLASNDKKQIGLDRISL